MSQTIIAKFDPINHGDLEDITKHLKQLGMTFSSGIKNHLFYIELKELPEIMFKLEQKGYFDDKPTKMWDILKMSENGIVLYVCSFHGGDGYIFLPKENIISFHTIGEEFLNAIAH